jgi:hypothetical protein
MKTNNKRMSNCCKDFKLLVVLFFSLFYQFSYSQESVDLKYERAKDAFYSENFEDANVLIKEIKLKYKSVPPKVAFLELIIKNKLIENNPLYDFSLLAETRKLVKIYKNKYQKFQNDNYKIVLEIGKILDQYPKDIIEYTKYKKEQIKAEELKKIEAKEAEILAKEKQKIQVLVNERIEKLKPYLSKINSDELGLGIINEGAFNLLVEKAKENKAIEIKESEIKKEKAKRRIEILAPYTSVINYYDLNIENLTDSEFQYQLSMAKQKLNDKENQKKIEQKRSDSYQKDYNMRKPFSSIGFQSGQIAKYGFIYETGGKNFIGFHMSLRTSNTPEEEILNGENVPNKNEFVLGPNFKLSPSIFINIGIGYGFYNSHERNDYAGISKITKNSYMVTPITLMIRLNRVISINGGASFMEIGKAFYKPEYIFGISFNLKSKYKS